MAQEEQQHQQQIQPAPQQVPQAGQSSVDQPVLLAAICYGIVPPLAVAFSLVMMYMRKSDAFVMFHAKQGLVFGVCGLIAMAIPYGNNYLAFIGFPVVAILAITHVFKKELWKMPVIADLVAMVGI